MVPGCCCWGLSQSSIFQCDLAIVPLWVQFLKRNQSNLYCPFINYEECPGNCPLHCAHRVFSKKLEVDFQTGWSRNAAVTVPCETPSLALDLDSIPGASLDACFPFSGAQVPHLKDENLLDIVTLLTTIVAILCKYRKLGLKKVNNLLVGLRLERKRWPEAQVYLQVGLFTPAGAGS